MNWAVDVRFELIPTLAAIGLFVPFITLRVYSSTVIMEAASSADRSVHFARLNEGSTLHGSQLSDFAVYFLNKMRDYKLLKDSSIWNYLKKM